MTDETPTPQNAPAVMLTFDRVGPLNRGIPAPQYNAPAFVERLYINLDGMQGADVGTHKDMDKMRVVGSVSDLDQPITLSWGAADLNSGDFVFGPKLPFDGTAGTEELFYQATGRWLGIRVEYHGDQSFTLSGIDANIFKNGDR